MGALPGTEKEVTLGQTAKKWCTYCRKADHDDKDCWSTRQASPEMYREAPRLPIVLPSATISVRKENEDILARIGAACILAAKDARNTALEEAEAVCANDLPPSCPTADEFMAGRNFQGARNVQAIRNLRKAEQ